MPAPRSRPLIILKGLRAAHRRATVHGGAVTGAGTSVPKKPRPSPPGLEIRAGNGELILFINGRRVQGNQTMLAVLASLFDNLGTVIPYEDLCLLIGHKSANSAATHVLRFVCNQHASEPRYVLSPYTITLAHRIGYGLCKMAGEPRRISTSRSALLELGRNLQRVRTAAGLTQAALAKRCGMDRSYVGGLEAGQRNPTAVTLQRLAKVLGVTPTVCRGASAVVRFSRCAGFAPSRSIDPR